MNDEIGVGSQAPEFRLLANDGREIGLADYRDEARVVLFLVREYSCAQCRSHVAQLARRYADLQAGGAEILVILGDTPDRIRDYAQLLKTPFPVLADPDCAIYHRYGLEKALIMIQRTASVVVDQHGVIQYLKRTTNPTLWLQESDQLLDFVVGLGVTAV